MNTAVMHSPATLVANIPTMIGFEPSNDLIGVWLKEGMVVVTQRADLDLAITRPAEFVEGPLRTTGADEVILLFYGTFDQDEADSFIAYAQADTTVRDAMWVRDGRWRSMLCSNLECCPEEGVEIDPELVMLPAAQPVAADREALRIEVAPCGTEPQKALDPHGIEGWRDKWIQRGIDAFLNDGFESVKQARGMSRALHDIRVRDALMWFMVSLDAEETRRAHGLLAASCRVTHPNDAAPVATCAAVAAWLAGDGARANIATEVAANADPDYSLLGLIEFVLQSALPPSSWAEAMKSLTYNDCRYGTQS